MYYNIYEALEQDLTEEEIVRAIKKLKRGKAGGMDGLKADVYKEIIAAKLQRKF